MITLSQNVSQSWLQNTSQVQPGVSAILNGNKVIFYTVHITAICIIITSLMSCVFVIIFILSNLRKDKRWDFSDRFPLYLSIADLLLGVSHLNDHFLVLITKKFPSKSTATGLSMSLWFFLGYQQLMHAGLAAYIYLKVVRSKNSLNLGKGEWKLQVFCLTMMSLSVAVFYPFGSFGSSGYWFLNDLHSIAGLMLGLFMGVVQTSCAICITISYRSVQKVIQVQNALMSTFQEKAGTNNVHGPRNHSVATQCLTTFVLIAVALYCSLAIGSWTFVLEGYFGFIEPCLVFLLVIVTNSSGWANALGYFYNRRVKAKAIESLPQNLATRTLDSSSASYN